MIQLKSVHPINWNPNGITITSIQFNSAGDYSPWVDRVFGSKAIVRRDEADIFQSFENFSKNYTIPRSAFWTSCSIELLGFARHDVEEPLTNTARFNRPAAGYAYLHFGENGDINDKNKNNNNNYNNSNGWKCYYRALHDTWRFQGFHTAPNFWAVFFYCPMDRLIGSQECDKMKQHTQQAHVNDEYARFNIHMNLQSINWTHTFHGNVYEKDKVVKKQQPFQQQLQLQTQPMIHHQIRSNMNHHQHRRKPTNTLPVTATANTAICLVLPYLADTQDRYDVNGALLIEFLRYYSLLGMKIFIYDRDGAHKSFIYGNDDDNDDHNSSSRSGNNNHHHNSYSNKNIHAYRTAHTISFNSSSSSSSSSSSLFQSDLVYHDYTIRNHLGDNLLNNLLKTDANYERILVDVTDEDKTNTLTHCRVEAKVVYNIDQIIVLDFDEFLYCPAGGSTITGQKQSVHNMLASYRQQGYEQLEFEQRMILPKMDNIQQCFLDVIKGNLDKHSASSSSSLSSSSQKFIDSSNNRNNNNNSSNNDILNENGQNLSKKSIFSCFSSYSNKVGRNRRKSIHLNLACPFTDFHQSCSGDYGINNCLCRNTFMYNQCAIVHLTLNQEKYNKFKKLNKNTVVTAATSSSSSSFDFTQDEKNKPFEILTALERYYDSSYNNNANGNHDVHNHRYHKHRKGNKAVTTIHNKNTNNNINNNNNNNKEKIN